VKSVAASEPAVVVRGLAKTFRTGWWGRPRADRTTRPALRDVSFEVPPGAIFGVLGPNGAGKTTLLSILATLLVPDEGEARVLGWDVVRDAGRIRERINLSSASTSFLWSLTPHEILDVAGRTYGLLGSARRRKVESLLDRFELRTHADQPYNELSTGLKQRLGLAKAFVNDPQVLILDEPTVGLDPDVSVRIRDEIVSVRRGRRTTILLSTHYMREADLLCDDLIFLREGRVLAHGDPATLKREILSGDRIVLTVDGGAAAVAARLPGVLGVKAEGEGVECVVDDARKRLPELLRHLEGQGFGVSGVQVLEPTLESVFIELAR
jgi:ABC-2 type transport system ATP-binding protein